MRLTFPEHASKIVIRARDNTWGNMGTARDGKQKFMASAAAELKKALDVDITRNTSKSICL